MNVTDSLIRCGNLQPNWERKKDYPKEVRADVSNDEKNSQNILACIRDCSSPPKKKKERKLLLLLKAVCTNSSSHRPYTLNYHQHLITVVTYYLEIDEEFLCNSCWKSINCGCWSSKVCSHANHEFSFVCYHVVETPAVLLIVLDVTREQGRRCFCLMFFFLLLSFFCFFSSFLSVCSAMFDRAK